MRQMIRKIMFTIIPFLLCMGIRFPAYAMTDEEKELFDALGVEYSLDEKGNFKAFHPPPWHSQLFLFTLPSLEMHLTLALV